MAARPRVRALHLDGRLDELEDPLHDDAMQRVGLVLHVDPIGQQRVECGEQRWHHRHHRLHRLQCKVEVLIGSTFNGGERTLSLRPTREKTHRHVLQSLGVTRVAETHQPSQRLPCAFIIPPAPSAPSSRLVPERAPAAKLWALSLVLGQFSVAACAER